ncbi:hypothetical protein Bbelb_232490 [Branchiostoma belcheri]|nr:hypothetical protein Bbelb_232490 [Branchiostoma belcheri]
MLLVKVFVGLWMFGCITGLVLNWDSLANLYRGWHADDKNKYYRILFEDGYAERNSAAKSESHLNCNNTYIGETSRPLKVRYKEHCRPSANGYSSAIFHHLQHNQGHSFKLESTDILDRETRWWERGVKEAIYERMYNPTLNREGGLRVDLSGTWDLALPAPRTDNT